jgi:hypothetical protein
MLIHSLAPWFLARHQPNLVRIACASLTRAGFEAWYPTYVDVRPTPLRKLSPGKRHLAHLFLQEVRRPRFVGYVFVRPLPWCTHDPNRLFELHGCGGIVSLGGKVAKIEDYDVEIMRIAEAQGTFDTVIGVGRGGRYRVSRLPDERQWVGQGRKLLNGNDAKQYGLLVDALGRVEEIVAQANGVETGLARKSARE